MYHDRTSFWISEQRILYSEIHLSRLQHYRLLPIPQNCPMQNINIILLVRMGLPLRLFITLCLLSICYIQLALVELVCLLPFPLGSGDKR
jgi:hypothetical protein